MTTSPKGSITVVGLGPAGPELMTVAIANALAVARPRFVRTLRHPGLDGIGGLVGFDEIYEAAGSIDAVYPEIVERLVAAAAEHGDVLYAVPGSPSVAEHTVELLLADDRVSVEVLPALSFADLSWTALGVDPLSDGVTIIDGHRFAAAIGGVTGPVLIAQCDSVSVLSEIKLGVDVDRPAVPPRVTVLSDLGTAAERVFDVAWDELDRSFVPNHLTSLYVTGLPADAGAELRRFDHMVQVLREQCPWDRAQTHHSLAPHLLEESYEVLEALDHFAAGASAASLDAGAVLLQEELGDLLFQVVLHSRIATQSGDFELADVIAGIDDKLRLRHPELFGSPAADHRTAAERVTDWERGKATEKGRASVMDGMPSALPAALRAQKVQRKARSQGFGFETVAQCAADVADELAEVMTEPSGDEAGDVLFAAVGLARALGADAEFELRRATDRFERRFRHVEAAAKDAGTTVADLDGDEVAALWADGKDQRG